MGLWTPEKCPGILRQGCPLPTARRKEALVSSRWGSACSSLHPERLRVRPLGKEPATWGSSRPQSGVGRGADLRSRFGALLGCSSHLHTLQRPPGLRIPRGSNSRGPTQQSRAQRRVTRGPSDTSGLGARKLPETVQVTLGSEGSSLHSPSSLPGCLLP